MDGSSPQRIVLHSQPLIVACCSSLRCGFSGNDRIRVLRLELIIRINADERSTVLTWDHRCARVNSPLSSRHVRQTSLVFSGKPKGNLPHRRIRRPHLSYDNFLALDRRLLSYEADTSCTVIATVIFFFPPKTPYRYERMRFFSIDLILFLMSWKIQIIINMRILFNRLMSCVDR